MEAIVSGGKIALIWARTRSGSTPGLTLINPKVICPALRSGFEPSFWARNSHVQNVLAVVRGDGAPVLAWDLEVSPGVFAGFAGWVLLMALPVAYVVDVGPVAPPAERPEPVDP